MPIGLNKVTGVNKKKDKKRFTDSNNHAQNEVKINGIDQQRVNDVNMGNSESGNQQYNRICFSKSAKNGMNDYEYWKSLLDNRCETFLDAKQGLKDQMPGKTDGIAVVDAGLDTETSISNKSVIVESKKKKSGKKKMKKSTSIPQNSVEGPANNHVENGCKASDDSCCSNFQEVKTNMVNELEKLEIATFTKDNVDNNAVVEEQNIGSLDGKNEDSDEMILVQRKRRSKIKASNVANKATQNVSMKQNNDHKLGRRNDGRNRAYSDKRGSNRFHDSKSNEIENHTSVTKKSASFDLESDFPPLSVEPVSPNGRRSSTQSSFVQTSKNDAKDEAVQIVDIKSEADHSRSMNDISDEVQEELPTVSSDTSVLTGKNGSNNELQTEVHVEKVTEQNEFKMDSDAIFDNTKEDDTKASSFHSVQNNHPRHYGHHGHRRHYEPRPQMSNIYSYMPTTPGHAEYNNAYVSSVPIHNQQILRPNFYMNQPRHPISSPIAYAALQPTSPHYSSGFIPHQSLLPIQLPINPGVHHAFTNGIFPNIQSISPEYPVLPLTNQYFNVQQSLSHASSFSPIVPSLHAEDSTLNSDNPSRESTPRADHIANNVSDVNAQNNVAVDDARADQNHQNSEDMGTHSPVIPSRAPNRVDTLCFSPNLEQTIREAFGLHPNEGVFYVYTVDSNSNHYRQFRCLMNSTTPIKFDGISFPVTLHPNYGSPDQISPAGYYYVARRPNSDGGSSTDSTANAPLVSTQFMPVSSFSAIIPEEYRIPPLPNYYENLVRVPETSDASVLSNNSASGASNVANNCYSRNLPNGSTPGSN